VVHRFDHVCVESGVRGSIAIFFLSPPGQRHDRQLFAPRRLADAAAHFVAVQTRQSDVEEYGVRPEPLGGFDRADAVVRLVRLVAVELQQHRQ